MTVRRYITKPNDWWGDWSNEPGPQPASITVWDREHLPQRTGLFDHLGNELYALDEAEPAGFVRGKR